MSGNLWCYRSSSHRSDKIDLISFFALPACLPDQGSIQSSSPAWFFFISLIKNIVTWTLQIKRSPEVVAEFITSNFSIWIGIKNLHDPAGGLQFWYCWTLFIPLSETIWQYNVVQFSGNCWSPNKRGFSLGACGKPGQFTLNPASKRPQFS